MEKKRKIIFWILIIVGILIRIYKFPIALTEMNCDEIMTVVQARAIAQTGKVLEGISYPIYLSGWGGQSVMLLYLMVLCMKIFGATLFPARLPMLLMSIISLFVIYDFTKKLTNNKTIALIALGLLVISPWHILQQMYGLDCNMFPHFLLIAMDLLYTGIINNKKYLTYISIIFFAMTLYCYGVAIYFVPLFLLISAIYLVKTKKIDIKTIIFCILIFVVLAMPIVTMFAINVLKINKSIEILGITIPYYEGLNRTKDMIFFAEKPIMQLFKNIFFTLVVTLAQFDRIAWNEPAIFGTIYHISIIFIIYEIIKSIKQRKNGILLLSVVICLFVGLIVNEANVNRLNSIWYIMIILTAIGIFDLYEKVQNKKIYKYAVTSLYIVLGISFIIYFYANYTKVVDKSICFSRGFYKSLSYVQTLDATDIYWVNLNRDYTMKLYLDFNNSENKTYKEIENQEQLDAKMQNLKENEVILIEDVDNKYTGYRIDNYVIIGGEK